MTDHLDNDKEELLNEKVTCPQCHFSHQLSDEDFARMNRGIDQYTQSKLKAFAEEVSKSLEGLEIDREATEAHIRKALDGKPIEEIDTGIMYANIDADDRHDVLNDVAQTLKAIKEKAGIE